MKTYVITLSQVFPTWHKRAGEPTKFRAAFLSGQTCSKCKKRNHAMCTSECFSGLKIHTIRANYPLWLKRITEVQQGKAVLSVRQWSGKPYRSPQIEITRLTVKHGVGIQKVVFYRTEWYDDDNKCHYCYDVTLDNDKGINIDDIARNDGLNPIDFIEWFDRDICKQMMVEFIKNLQLFTSLNSGIDMKPKEFFDAVVRMREKQQEYFKTKTSSALTESKRLERVIDDEIERVQRIIHEKQNPKLWQD